MLTNVKKFTFSHDCLVYTGVYAVIYQIHHPEQLHLRSEQLFPLEYSSWILHEHNEREKIVKIDILHLLKVPIPSALHKHMADFHV